MKTKKLWITIGVIVLIVAIIIGIQISQSTKEEEVIKIGAILPLTGPAAFYGETTKNGIDLYIKQINSKGGVKGKKVKVLYEDGKNDPSTSIMAFNKLVSIHRVPVIFTALSGITKSLKSLADKTKTCLIALGASLANITLGSEYTFRVFYSIDAYLPILAKYIYNKMKLKRVACFYVNDDYGIMSRDIFTKCFEDIGGRVVWSESFKKGEMDFKSSIAKLVKSATFDGIYIMGYGQDIAILTKQLRELKITKPIFTVGSITDPSVRAQLGEALDNIYFPAPKFNPDKPTSAKAEEFMKSYKFKTGESPTFYSAFAYDAIALVINAISNYEYDVEKIKEGLSNTKDFEGVIGNITVMPNRDISIPVVIMKIEKNKIIEVENYEN